MQNPQNHAVTLVFLINNGVWKLATGEFARTFNATYFAELGVRRKPIH